MFPRFIIHTSYLIILFACLSASSHAEELKRQLPVNQAWKVELTGTAAEMHMRDPRGYGQHGAGKRVFTQRITLTNVGPVPLTGRLLVVDGKDWSSQDALAKSLRLPTLPRALVESFYTFWKEQRSHASSGTDAAEDPIGVLNFWGYTLCGDDTHALNRFFLKKAGIPGRRIALNGHTVGEYFYDDAWHVIDGDQVACYLKLDNRTLASAADIVADPLLALRTKVLGKHAPVSQANSAFNTSLFEFIAPRDSKPMRVKTPDIVLPAETLWPGEKIIYHADRAPEQPVGKTNLNEWEGARESALCLVEWMIDPKARSAGIDTTGNLTVRFAYPIVSAQVRDSGVSLPVAKGEPVFELTFKASTVAGPISVFCQRSRISMPTLDTTDSQLMVVASDVRGQAQLTVEYQPAVVPKAPELASNGAALPQFAGSPLFGVGRI